MNSKQIYTLIEQVAATPGKNDKQALLAEYAANGNLRRVLRAALDPTITYGMQKVPLPFEPKKLGDACFLGNFDDETWALLDGMAKREVTGNIARDMVGDMLGCLNVESAELMKRIITKDLRAGFGASTVNKVVKGLIPTFPYMRCSLPKEVKLDKFDWDGGVFSQEKADAMFANLDHEEGGLIRITSREGSEFPLHQMPELTQAVTAYLQRNTRTHGELIVIDSDGNRLTREKSNGIANSLLSGEVLPPGNSVIFLAWDQIPLDWALPKGLCSTPYWLRLDRLAAQIGYGDRGDGDPLCVIDTRTVYSLEEARQHFREMLAAGKEGTVFKDRNAVWEDKTSKWQVKLKLDFDADLEIVGFNPGDGKNAATFGSVLAKTADGLLVVGVSGFKDAVRKEFWSSRDELLGKIMTVKANCILPPGDSSPLHSLFLPRFVEIRSDKREADTLQRVFDQYEAAIAGA